MKTIYILLIAFAVALFASCSPEEVVNTSEQNLHILAVLAQTPGCLSSIKMPESTVEHADLLARAGIAVTGNPISSVRFFMNRTYVAVPADGKIYVLSDTNYSKLAEIDFSQTGDSPVDICFPNSTSAYVLCTSTSKVHVLDIYSDYKKIESITVGANPVAINCFLNKVFVASYNDNRVSVIDTRSNKIESTIVTADRPAFLEVIPEVSRLAIVCRGKGKEAGSTEAKTDAIVNLYDLTTMTLKKDIPLAKGSFAASAQNPVSVTSNATGQAFILSSNYIFRLETIAGVRLDLYKKLNSNFLNYSRWLDRLIVSQQVSKRPMLTFNTAATAEESSKVLPDTAIMAYPVR